MSAELDYEGEFGVVIGSRCRHVPTERAREVIGGYLVANDVSVRDWQRASPQWSMGKSFDTHCPIGPWLTLEEEIDPGDEGLPLRTWVNGQLRQDSTTSNLLFGANELIAFLSQACTLEPGDIILTGTPSGVGGAMAPPAIWPPATRCESRSRGWAQSSTRSLMNRPKRRASGSTSWWDRSDGIWSVVSGAGRPAGTSDRATADLRPKSPVTATTVDCAKC